MQIVPTHLQHLVQINRFWHIIVKIVLHRFFQRHQWFSQQIIVFILDKIHPANQRIFAPQIRCDWVFVQHCAKTPRHLSIWNKNRQIHVKIVILAFGHFVWKIGICQCNCHHKKPVMRTPRLCI